MGDMVAYGRYCMMAYGRYFVLWEVLYDGLLEIWWLMGDMVGYRRCGGLCEIWWVIGDVVTYVRYGGL